MRLTELIKALQEISDDNYCDKLYDLPVYTSTKTHDSKVVGVGTMDDCYTDAEGEDRYEPYAVVIYTE